MNSLEPPPPYSLGDVITFFDDQVERLPDESGCNQWAVVVDNIRALFLRRNSVFITLTDANQLPNWHLNKPRSTDVGTKVAGFFLTHYRKPAYVQAGFTALASYNLSPFLMGDLFPDKPSYTNDEEYERAWAQMISAMRPFDCIFTKSLTSPLSRFIAWFTHGAFSHVAVYDGAGSIGESVTTGTRFVPIENYKSRSNWVAAYRHIDAGQLTIEQAQRLLDRRPRSGYGYKGAICAGIKAFLGNHKGAQTPNSMIYQGIYQFIAQA